MCPSIPSSSFKSLTRLQANFNPVITTKNATKEGNSTTCEKQHNKKKTKKSKKSKKRVVSTLADASNEPSSPLSLMLSNQLQKQRENLRSINLVFIWLPKKRSKNLKKPNWCKQPKLPWNQHQIYEKCLEPSHYPQYAYSKGKASPGP